MTAVLPTSEAASATAWAWFPDEQAATPRARSAGESCAIRLYAPRNLNEPVRWNDSIFSRTRAPVAASSRVDRRTGVAWAMPPSRRAAARMRARSRPADSEAGSRAAASVTASDAGHGARGGALLLFLRGPLLLEVVLGLLLGPLLGTLVLVRHGHRLLGCRPDCMAPRPHRDRMRPRCSRLVRLWPGRNSSMWGSAAAMPRARGSYRGLPFRGLTHTTR